MNNAHTARPFRLTAKILERASDYGTIPRLRNASAEEIFSLLCLHGIIAHPDADDMSDSQWRKFCKAVEEYRR